MAKATTSSTRQGKRLQRLREARGLSPALLVHRLGFITTTGAYSLYENGVSVIRMDQIPQWAEAFEMSDVDFINSVFGDADPAPWSLEADLRAACIPEWAVQRAVQAAHDEPQVIQRWIAEKLHEMHAAGEIPCEPPAVNAPSPLAFLRHA